VGPAHRHDGMLTAPDDRLPARTTSTCPLSGALASLARSSCCSALHRNWHRSGRTSSASTSTRGTFSSGSWFESVEDLIRNPESSSAPRRTQHPQGPGLHARPEEDRVGAPRSTQMTTSPKTSELVSWGWPVQHLEPRERRERRRDAERGEPCTSHTTAALCRSEVCQNSATSDLWPSLPSNERRLNLSLPIVTRSGLSSRKRQRRVTFHTENRSYRTGEDRNRAGHLARYAIGVARYHCLADRFPEAIRGHSGTVAQDRGCCPEVNTLKP
jgi:hypothetical protein